MISLSKPVNLGAIPEGGRLLSEGFHTLFYDELREAQPQFSKIYSIKDSIKRQETSLEYVGLTLAQEAVIGGPSEFESPLDGGTKTVKMLLYKRGFQVAEEDEEDDLYGPLGEIGKDLPKCFTRRVESVCAAHFTNMFSTTTGFDGLPIVSKVHPFPAGRRNVTTGATTWSNRPDVDSALSPETLGTLQTLLRQTRTREGMPAGLRGNVLVVPVELEKRAWETITSMNKAFSDTNEKNIWGSGGMWPLKVLAWEWIPSAKMYALIDDGHSPFEWYWRRRPQFRSQTDINNGIKQFFGRMRGAANANDPRGIAATPGG